MKHRIFTMTLSRSFFQCLVGCFQCRSTYLLLDGPSTMRILGNEHWDIVGQTYAYIGYIGYIGYPIYRINKYMWDIVDIPSHSVA